MASLNVSVPDDLSEFVDRRMKETRHATPTDYVRALICEDLKRAEHERLEKLVADGLDSGKPIPIDNLDDYFAGKKDALSARINAQAARP
jgi:antitoxin ParD1/3/4